MFSSFPRTILSLLRTGRKRIYASLSIDFSRVHVAIISTFVVSTPRYLHTWYRLYKSLIEGSRSTFEREGSTEIGSDGDNLGPSKISVDHAAAVEM